MWRIARRPKWIALLVLALAVAAVFAALGQWQLERSIEAATVIERDTESAVPLASIAEPQQVMTSNASGRIITVTGNWVDGDDVTVTGRQSAGEPGDWIVRHFVTDDGASLTVAVGYIAPGKAMPSLELGAATLTGRYVPSESPQESDFEAGERNVIAVADFINLWDEVGLVYSGYLALADAPPGVETIAAPPPELDAELNLLNLFYALEWVIFGGFAIYLWWRLVKDEWEKEQAEAVELGADSGTADAEDPLGVRP